LACIIKALMIFKPH